jgi:small subunit ribosomal protein S6
MRRYETFIITDPDLPQENLSALIDRINGLIPEKGGLTVLTDDWGVRKLAYEIKKKPRGRYIRFDFCGDGELVEEMERQFRIDDRVMKYMTVLLNESVDLTKIKEEMAKAQEDTSTTAASDENVSPSADQASAAESSAAEPNPDTGKAVDAQATKSDESKPAEDTGKE